MNLLAIKTEALNHGFDPVMYGDRFVQYINDGQNLIARRVDYYASEATTLIATTAGTSTYPWPTAPTPGVNMFSLLHPPVNDPPVARIRSIFDTDRNVEMQYVSIRDIDRSPQTTGAPFFYALVGQNTTLYPTPDGVYNLEMRYWAMPPALVNDDDVPTLPVDYHSLLWVYAVWQGFESEDDAQMGGYWQKRFTDGLSMFTADAKFPSTDGPVVARGMWEQDTSLSPAGWRLGG